MSRLNPVHSVLCTAALASAAAATLLLLDPTAPEPLRRASTGPGDAGTANTHGPHQLARLEARRTEEEPLAQGVEDAPGADVDPDARTLSKLEQQDRQWRHFQHWSSRELPPAQDLVESALWNPERRRFSPEEVAFLDAHIEELNRELFQVRQLHREIARRCVEDRIARGKFETLVASSPRGAGQLPGGTLSFTRHSKGEPPIRVLIRPFEYPELDEVRALRDERDTRSRALLSELFPRAGLQERES